MTSTVSPAQDFFDHLSHANNLTGRARVSAYDQLMTMAGPALQAAAAEEFPLATVLTFSVNYTDEGSALYLTGHRTADGAFHERVDSIEAGLIDEIVFVTTGSGENGSNIAGMLPTSPDCYELQITNNL